MDRQRTPTCPPSSAEKQSTVAGSLSVDEKPAAHPSSGSPTARASAISEKNGATTLAPAPPVFDVPQAGIPRVLGLPMERVVAWRDGHLCQGVDWHRGTRQEVFWTRHALDAFGAVLGLQPEELKMPAGEGKPAADLHPAFRTVRWLTAWRATKNPRILLAHFAERPPQTARDLVRVAVRDCAQFRKGQRLAARWKDADLWVHDRSAVAELNSERSNAADKSTTV